MEPILIPFLLGLLAIFMHNRIKRDLDCSNRILDRLPIYRKRLDEDAMSSDGTAAAYRWIAEDMDILVREYEVCVSRRKSKKLNRKYEEYTHLDEIEYDSFLNMFLDHMESSHSKLNSFIDEFEFIVRDDVVRKILTKLGLTSRL
jgi:hypothetical protein